MGDQLGGILIGQWNLNSYYQRKNEVEVMVNNLNLDVLVMNDTRCCSNFGLELRGFCTERNDHPDNSRRPGGSAIAVRENLTYKRINTSVKESLCIEINLSVGKLRILTIYAHPGELIDRKLIEEAESGADLSTSFLFIGDFNAHVGLEEGRDADCAGLHLIDVMNRFDYHLLNNSEPTYSSCNNSSMTSIDLAFLKSNCTSGIRAFWEVLDPGSSDHFATLVTLNGVRNGMNQMNKGLTIAITDWDLYSHGLENNLKLPKMEPKNCADVDALITHIECTIKTQLEIATKNIKVLKRDDFVLSKESRILIELRRSMLKFRRRNKQIGVVLTRKILNRLSYDIKKQIKRDKDTHEQRKASAVMRETNPTKKWKLFKNFTGGGNKGVKIGDIIDLDNVRQTEEQAKSNAFAERLKISHSYPISSTFDIECEQDVKISYSSLEPLSTPSFILSDDGFSQLLDNDNHEMITESEVETHLRKTNSKAASGPDKITYKHLKEGGEKLLSVLCYLFNIIMISGYFPNRWRHVDVKMLHKTGKPKLPVANFRPISLSNSLSKLFECCVKSRFEKKLSRIREENLRQSAYKKKRGTQENCLKLTEDIVNAFNKRECVVGTFLDVSGAFDKVWREGLIVKIARWGIGRRLTRVITNFLTSRSLVVKVGNAVSEVVYLLAGTPQGSVLSPTLFNAYMDDLWHLIPSGVELLQYADDICIYASGSDPDICARKIQEALDVIERWAGIWRISMAPEKSNWILFSRCPSHKQGNIILKMYNKEIPNCKQIKFLGILFDERLTWKAYLDSILRHATSKATQIQALSAKNRFNSPIQAIGFFNSVIKPLFDYGAVVFYAISLNQWNRLDKFHGRFLRSICGLPKCCSYTKLCDQLQQEKLSIQVKDQAANRTLGICKNSPYGATWVMERGFEWREGSLHRISTHSQYDVYRSPVELALDRYLQLETLS